LGVGISNHGTAYEIEFPINQNQNIGGWAYKDNVTSAGGLKLRF
jgi:hypothetical protein